MNKKEENLYKNKKEEVIDKLYEAALDYEKESLKYEKEKLLKHINNSNKK